MGDPGSKPQFNVSNKSTSQFRSQSLPRLASASTTVGVGTSVAHQPGNPAAAGAAGPAGAAPNRSLQESRFQRTVRAVIDCIHEVKELSQLANSAKTFREECSSLLGAAIAASVALQESLGGAADGELNVKHCAATLQAKLQSAKALVRKYSQESMVDKLLRFESKDQVAAKFKGLIKELQAIANELWDLIDPGNRIKRDFASQDPAVSRMLTSGNAFSRQSLRHASQTKVSGLLAFPDEDSEQGHDGVVAWAADKDIKIVLPSSKVTSSIQGAGTNLTCMVYDPSGYLWAGYKGGMICLWSIDEAAKATDPLMVADAAITALAVDSDTGYCWVGTAEGVVVVVRFTRSSPMKYYGSLDHHRTLLGYDAHSPTTRSIDSNNSQASSGQPISTAAGTSSSSHWRPGTQQQRQQQPQGRQGFSSSQARGGPNQQRGIAEVPSGGLHGGIELLESCLGGGVQVPGSQRLKDFCVHAGPVMAILISGGRAYTAGGSSASTAALLIWDTNSCELLKTISKRSSQWYRCPTTSMTMVHWAVTRRAMSMTPGTLSHHSSGAVFSDSDGSGVYSGPSTSSQHRTSSSSGCAPDRHLITGHADGSVILWDPSGDTLRPVLLIGPNRGSKKAVKGVVVLEELGVLACGHADGKVLMRKLPGGAPNNPKVPLHARCEGNVPRWDPTAFILQAHKLGLTRMTGHGHLLITSGKTGSIKLWPETTIRWLASEASIQLPFSRNPISEAVNSLLKNVGMTAYPSTVPARQISLAIAQASGPSTSHHSSGGGSAVLPQQQQQQESEQALPISLKARTAPAVATAAGLLASQKQQNQIQQQEQQQQEEQQEGPGEQLEQQQAAAAARGPPLLQHTSSGNRWGEQVQASSWCIEWGQLHMDHSRVIGRGSYGRVEIGCYNQTDVAVKILTDQPGSGNSRASADHHSVIWDEARLKKLRHEVCILSTLRHPNVVLFMGVCLSPPAVVTEFCPLRSLYDVLQKANSDASMAARLTWQRRLRMALDAAKGMLYLHSHKPTILHRDLKSPNLFVTNSYMVKVGDFNLSRYMSLDRTFVQSSLELNPRWSAPEVIKQGNYSKAADVYSFGVVLWELLTWQEPWAEELSSSYQIMIAVQQEGQRPQLPSYDQLPGQVGPAAAASAYVALMEDCWAQDYQERPSFEAVVERLKDLLRVQGPNLHPGVVAGAAPAALPGQSPLRGSSTGALLAAAAADAAAARAMAQPDTGSPSGVAPPPVLAATPAAAEAAAAAGVGPGGCHLRSRSELVGAKNGPQYADLLQLGQGDEDDLLGPTAPRPPAAALPPIPGTSEGTQDSNESLGLSPAAAAAAGADVSATSLPPKPPLRRPSGAGVSASFAAAAAAGRPSPFAAATTQSPFGMANQQQPWQQQDQQVQQQQSEQQMQQQEPQQGALLPVSFGAFHHAAANGNSHSPFASQTVQQAGPVAVAPVGAPPMQQQQPPQGLITPATALHVSTQGAAGAAGNERGRSGGDAGAAATTPAGARSPSNIRPSPFASSAAVAALQSGDSSSGPVVTLDTESGSFVASSSAFPVTRSGDGGMNGSVTSGTTALATPVVDNHAAQVCLEAAVDASSAVDPSMRRSRQSGSSGRASSTGGVQQSAAAAAVSGIAEPQQQSAAAAAVATDAAAAAAAAACKEAAAASHCSQSSRIQIQSISMWNQQEQVQGVRPVQQSPAAAAVASGTAGSSSSSTAVIVHDLITLHSES